MFVTIERRLEMTTKDQIRLWLTIGRRNNASHVAVLYDPKYKIDIPVYVYLNRNVKDHLKNYMNVHGKHVIMEVYDLSRDIEYQLSIPRVFYYN